MERKLTALLNKEKDIVSVTGNTTIKSAVDIMVNNNIGALIVKDEKDKVIGIFTEKDIMKKLAATNACIHALPVTDLMTHKEKLIVGSITDDINHLMKIMADNDIRHIPIMNKDGKMVGIISIRDFMKLSLVESKKKVKYLNDYIMGKYPN